MNAYVAEFLGTAILVLLGNGAVCNVLLDRTKGYNAGWIVVSAGWGLAVFVAVLCTEQFSGAHINPAVTFGVALAGSFAWDLVPGYVGAQLAGAFVGALLVYLFYQLHYQVTSDADAKLATFSTCPAIRSTWANFTSELIATFVLVFAVLVASKVTIQAANGELPQTIGLGMVGALPVGLLVFAIGLSLGGTTGYAINPARDLGPRIAHALLPVPGKGGSDWTYGWIPVVGPLVGGGLAAVVYRLVVS
jgi:glycerol uptake facilitator protein